MELFMSEPEDKWFLHPIDNERRKIQLTYLRSLGDSFTFQFTIHEALALSNQIRLLARQIEEKRLEEYFGDHGDS